MKILGIGNAIVDVICKVNDSFITKNNLTKGLMKLIFDEGEFSNLLTNLKIEKTISGGSVANSIVGLSQLGDKVGFITDGRFSGGTHGFVVGHISPEAAEGGNIALVENGDTILIDAENDQLILKVEDKVLDERRSNWTNPIKTPKKGVLAKYAKSVKSASLGATTD